MSFSWTSFVERLGGNNPARPAVELEGFTHRV
jgi:hypothetical protein